MFTVRQVPNQGFIYYQGLYVDSQTHKLLYYLGCPLISFRRLEVPTHTLIFHRSSVPIGSLLTYGPMKNYLLRSFLTIVLGRLMSSYIGTCAIFSSRSNMAIMIPSDENCWMDRDFSSIIRSQRIDVTLHVFSTHRSPGWSIYWIQYFGTVKHWVTAPMAITEPGHKMTITLLYMYSNTLGSWQSRCPFQRAPGEALLWEKTRYTLGGTLAKDSSTPLVQLFLQPLRNPQ